MELISGPSGKIEVSVSSSDSERSIVICHPHPLYGGSMNDMVVGVLASTFEASGFTTIRFNFRGVGASEGQHDEGAGESVDVEAVAEWLRASTGCKELWLAGYSFGAGMALKAANVIKCDKLVLVAPPVVMMSDLPRPEMPTLAILGEDDKIVRRDETESWLLSGASEQTTEVTVLDQADHFSIGGHPDLSRAVENYLGISG